LWLARSVVAHCPRPWQKAQPELTPGRVHQAMGGVLATIGTPTAVPKPRGKSPGWSQGRLRTKRTRYPVVKKQTKAGAMTTKQAFTTQNSSP
jgi:hypothetical protein